MTTSHSAKPPKDGGKRLVIAIPLGNHETVAKWLVMVMCGNAQKVAALIAMMKLAAKIHPQV